MSRNTPARRIYFLSKFKIAPKPGKDGVSGVLQDASQGFLEHIKDRAGFELFAISAGRTANGGEKRGGSRQVFEGLGQLEGLIGENVGAEATLLVRPEE